MLKLLSECFTSENVNTGRQVELDIAKGFAIIFMVITHTYEKFSTWSNPWATKIFFEVCGGPLAAGVFMFCMGINICYSRNTAPAHFFYRGCKLLMLGLLLSILRDLLPDLLYYYSANASFPFGSDLAGMVLKMISEIDILQFSGIFFLVFALLKKMRLSLVQMNIFASILLITGQLLRHVTSGNYYADILFGFLWGTHDTIWFPYFNWCIVPIAGYTFGNFWLHCKNKDTFYRVVTVPSCILSISYFCISDGYQNLGNYYLLGVWAALFTLCTALSMLGCSHFLSIHLKGIISIMHWLSKELTAIYMIHWALIANISMLIYLSFGPSFFQETDIYILPLSFIILLITCVLVKLYHRLCSINLKH